MSPIIVKCARCGTVLHEDYGRTIWLEYMNDVISKLNRRCPRCSHPLKLPPKQVCVSAYRERLGVGRSTLKRQRVAGLAEQASIKLNAESGLKGSGGTPDSEKTEERGLLRPDPTPNWHKKLAKRLQRLRAKILEWYRP